MMLRQRFLLLITLGMLGGCVGPSTVVVTVRHAEKQTTGNDPALSAAGQQRAQALSDRLSGSNIKAVYTTDTRRTRETARPLADSLGLTMRVYSTPADVARQVLAQHRGDAVLVVGHSNTVGDIVLAFGADLPDGLPQPITENDYDNMVTIVVNGEGKAAAVHTTFGAASP